MKNQFKRISIFIVVFIMISVHSLLPAYGFSIGEEREVGEKLLFAVRSNFPLLNDPDIYQYINNLGQDVLSVVGPQYFDFRFFVINDREFNAFSAFSGMIFFYAGLIESVNSENELVSVMAHEIGHTVKRHLATSIEQGGAISTGSLLLALASMAMGGGVATEALLSGSMAANQSLNLHYSRLHEQEADLLSYGWMKKMGRNPEAMEKMLQTMRRITRYRSSKLPQYFLTHPDPEARLDYVDSLLIKDKDEISKMKDGDDFAFLRFKYRIMSIADDHSNFRSYLAEKIADSRSSQLDLTMAKYGLSLLDRDENNFDSSLQLLGEVIKAFPDKNILLDDKGVTEFAAGKLQNALATLSRAYKENPRDYYAAFYLAKVQISLNNLTEAEKYLDTLVGEMPDYAQIYYELGHIKANQRKDGDSTYYLWKYYFYSGKTMLAKQMLKAAVEKKDLDVVFKNDALDTMKTIDRVEGKK